MLFRSEMLKVCVVLLLSVALCYAQSEIKLTIDPFTINTPPIIIVIENQNFPLSDDTSTPGDNILGGERDLLLTVENGAVGLLLSTGVSNGAWNMGTPNSASGFALLQYDGVDGTSALNRNGLGGIDLTANGATAFRAVIQSDIETSYVFRIFSGNAESSLTQPIPGTSQSAEYLFSFSQFTGNADFTNVGAVELQVNAFDNVDSFISFFGTHGPVSSISPSPAARPSRSPSPSPVPEWYTFDDDDNGVSPCTTNEKRRTYFLTESNIIYYYFYGFNDPYQNQYLSSASSASVLGLSVVLALFSFVILF